MSHVRPPALSTCAIGSLPHTQTELALQHHLLLDIPTLPQLPRQDAAEYMLPQALDGLPGLTWNEEGQTTLELTAWEKGRRAFDEQLTAALEGGHSEGFEPSASTTRAWRPFLWEIETRRAAFAKVQITGPLTAVWATRLSDGTPLSDHKEATAQAVRLVFARALAMVRAVRATGAVPFISLDEPALFAFDKRRPTHLVELNELAIAAKALSREGAIVGLHCCSNTDWAAVLKLPFDVVSADTRLSLAALLATGPVLDAYLARGGWLALGLVPTSTPEHAPMEELVDDALATMGDRRAAILARALLTPACGLATRTLPEAGQALADLREAQRLIRELQR